VPLITVDAAAAVEGPAWLRGPRMAAAERAAAAPLPTTAEEIWRYSRIGELDPDRYQPVAPPAGGEARVPDAVSALLARVPDPAATVVVVDGRVVAAQVRPDLEAKGLRVGPLAPDAAEEPWLAERDDRTTDVFADMALAMVGRPVVIDVPAGLVVDAPVVVAGWLDQDGVAFSRLIVRAGADSEVTVLDHVASGDADALALPLVELDASPAARLRYLAVNELGPRTWQIASQVARGDSDSSTLLSNVALGGDYARVRCDARLEGRGASGRQLAVFFGERSQMHDIRTLQDHAAPKTTSDLLFKGAVQDHSRSVYTGLIRVRKEATGTAAFQTNRNLKLSEHAWAESVPNLEIETNDVRCSHASAVGPVDEEQRFYLESRGVPPHVAERLIVLGFFGEVLEHLPVPDLGPGIVREVAARLDRRQA